MAKCFAIKPNNEAIFVGSSFFGENGMSKLIGLLMVLAGIFVGLYLGLWVCFIGGIAGLINQVKSPEPVVAMTIAINITKIIFASVVGWVSALLLAIPGMALLDDK